MPCRCCEDVDLAPRRRVYGPPPWAGYWAWPVVGPTKAERREWLQAHKKRLQERLADIDEELSKS
jgi:hypothetical protein